VRLRFYLKSEQSLVPRHEGNVSQAVLPTGFFLFGAEPQAAYVFHFSLALALQNKLFYGLGKRHIQICPLSSPTSTFPIRSHSQILRD